LAGQAILAGEYEQRQEDGIERSSRLHPEVAASATAVPEPIYCAMAANTVACTTVLAI